MPITVAASSCLLMHDAVGHIVQQQSWCVLIVGRTRLTLPCMQETGLDTVDANRALGLPDDCREYTSVTNILANLGVKSIHLMVGEAL